MITETINIKEYHDNGALWIDEIRCYVADNTIDFYGAILIKSFADGRYFFRKQVIKYYDNGQFAWRLDRNELGISIEIDARKYRKDGSGIN